MLERDYQNIDSFKFNSERDITPQEKEQIDFGFTFLHKNAITTADPVTWEVYIGCSKNRKILFPNENDPNVNANMYNAINDISEDHLKKGHLNRFLELAACKKILYPQEWTWGAKGKDYYTDEIIWDILVNHLIYTKPQEYWETPEVKLDFFTYAQNLKVVAPKRFESLNLQKILGTDIWIEDIVDGLEQASNDYWEFASLASTLHILEYPGKIELDSLEWAEMSEEAQRIKEEESILDFANFSAKRTILAAKEVKITEDSFDLIF